MKTVYKLTNDKDQTYDGTQWGENVTHRAAPGKMDACTKTAIHFYTHPLEAVLFNPAHANFEKYHLWEARVTGRAKHDGLKGICKELTTIRRIDAPEITTSQRVRFAILCALEVYHDESFVAWANKWLSGEDRTARAAEAARAVAGAARDVAGAAGAARAAWAVAGAAEAATETAAWAAGAARAAADINFVALAERAIADEV